MSKATDDTSPSNKSYKVGLHITSDVIGIVEYENNKGDNKDVKEDIFNFTDSSATNINRL